MLRAVGSAAARLGDGPELGRAVLAGRPDLAPAVLAALAQLQGDRVPEVSALACERAKEFRERLGDLEGAP